MKGDRLPLGAVRPGPARLAGLTVRHHLGGRHYPAWAPRILWHRLTHRLAGPLLGCSCSRCFHSRWRLEYPARDAYADRQRIAHLERRVRDMEQVKRAEADRRREQLTALVGRERRPRPTGYGDGREGSP